jgi:Flp pilus assembly secretin CpaC
MHFGKRGTGSDLDRCRARAAWCAHAATGLLCLLVIGAAPRLAAAQVAQRLTPVAETVIKAQHVYLPFSKNIARVAVGDSDILYAELISNREVLALGRETGRTTLIVWFTDGTMQTYLFLVQRDLAALQNALSRVHPNIEVESAPDRDAIILTGIVPNLQISQTAEAVARTYLEAGETRRGLARPLLAAPGQPPAPAAPPATAPAEPGAPAGAAPGGVPQPAASPTPTSAPAPETSRVQGEVQPSGTVINLLQLETLPPLPEQKILEAVQAIGGERVTIRRILHGNIRDDARDTFVLEGVVPNQIALVRIVEIAARVLTGQAISEEDIRVVADESGGLSGRVLDSQLQQQNQITLGAAGAASSLFGGARSGLRLSNMLRRNLGRAKAIEAANGRIVSFIDVMDLPQIRVDIRLVEVNRTKLRGFNPDTTLLVSSFQQPALSPAQGAVGVQGTRAAHVGGVSGTAVQEVLSFLSGGLVNEFQLAARQVAVDAAISLLEREGIARTLSSPSLTVLSGESALFRVGGEIPIPIAFSPAFGGTTAVTPGVFGSVDFVPFGLQLEIRPLVGGNDTITLDVQPQVVTPDTTLTDAVRQTTGTNPQTAAFQTRALRTSSRLQDGQTLLIGGLTADNQSRNATSAPGLSDVPALGWLFTRFTHNDQSTDLMVVVNPVILRSPIPDAGLWAFPGRDELLRLAIRRAEASTVK